MSKNRFGVLKVYLVLLIVFFLFAFFYFSSGKFVEKDRFQAVFLTNNQVYFGNISKITSQNIVLSNVYYLQSNDTTAVEQDTKLNLVKLGTEVHSPEDTMYISRSQVLFWENLKKDSKISQFAEKK